MDKLEWSGFLAVVLSSEVCTEHTWKSWLWEKGGNLFLWNTVFFFLKTCFYWSIVDLQRCVNFCCTAKWFTYSCTSILFNIPIRCGLSQNSEYSSLCCSVGPYCLSILCLLLCICWPQIPWRTWFWFEICLNFTIKVSHSLFLSCQFSTVYAWQGKGVVCKNSEYSKI